MAIEGRAEKHVTREELERLLAWKLAVRGFHVGGGTAAGGPASWGRGFTWGWPLAAWGGAPFRRRVLMLWGGVPLERPSTSDHPTQSDSATEGPLPSSPAAAGGHQPPGAGGAVFGCCLPPPSRHAGSNHRTVRPPGRGPRHGLGLVGRAGHTCRVAGGTWPASVFEIRADAQAHDAEGPWE